MLLQAVNGHINRGGEFEKRAAFVKKADLPVGTVGLGNTSTGLMVWGIAPKPPAAGSLAIPAGIQYQQLVHPFVPTMALATINSYALYKNGLYVSATFSDGDTYHYYNGVNVSDWDYGCSKVNFKVTGGSNIAAKQASAKFKITGGTRAVGNRVNGVFVNGLVITRDVIPHTGSNTTTAAAVATEINRWVSNPNYTAYATNDVVTVVASTLGTAINGKLVQVTVQGNVTTNAPVNMAGGVNASQSTIDLSVDGYDLMAATGWRTSNAETAKAVVAAINAYHGVRDYHAVWDGADGVAVMPNLPGISTNGRTLARTLTNGFTVSPVFTAPAVAWVFAGGKDSTPPSSAPLNLPYAPGDFVLTHGKKMYALSGGTVYFSKRDDPSLWHVSTANVGAGFIDMSAEVSGAEELMSMAKYQNYLAIFAYSNIIIEFTDPDPNLNKMSQVLRNTGTRSPHSVVQFGDNDIYYLDESGVRSVRARDSSNSASTADVGVLVDPLVTAKLKTMSMGQRMKVFGLIEPADGRVWLTMGDLIFVFSYFSGAKVSAWSIYIPSTPGTKPPSPDGSPPADIPFSIDEALVFRRRIYVRSGDAIYCFGGEGTALTYDACEAVMQTPFLDGDKPAREKSFNGWDASVRGVWNVSVSLDPTQSAQILPVFPKGTVPNFAGLPSNPAINDAYITADTGEIWVWTGKMWTIGRGKAEILGTIDETTTPHNRLTFNAQSTHVSVTFRSREASAAKVSNVLIHYQSDSGTDDGTR